MKVLINGAGIAGLALANFLRRAPRRHTIVVVEKLTSFPSAWTISFLAHGLRVLEKLGILDTIQKNSVAFERATYFDHNGRVIRSIKMEYAIWDPKTDLPMINTSREAIHSTLLATATASPFGQNVVEVRAGLTATSFQETSLSVIVQFSDSRTEEFDLVVSAEGIHSPVRQHMYPTTFDTHTHTHTLFTGGLATGFWAPPHLVPDAFPKSFTELIQFWGNKKYAYAFPGVTSDGKRQVSIAFSELVRPPVWCHGTNSFHKETVVLLSVKHL